MTRIEQAKKLLEIAEKIESAERDYEQYIQNIVIKKQNPYDNPLFDEEKEKKHAEIMAAELFGLKKYYNDILTVQISIDQKNIKVGEKYMATWHYGYDMAECETGKIAIEEIYPSYGFRFSTYRKFGKAEFNSGQCRGGIQLIKKV